MGALFGDTPVVDDNDAVGVVDSRKPMGDDDGGAPDEQFVEGFLHELFALGVEGRSRFVEEYGLLLAVGLLMLYLWIFFRAIEIFRRCGTAFPGLLVLGLALLITCQALLHIMVTVNLIPETGQTLPLISRGGSSTLFTTIALGMILSVSRQNDEQSHDTPRSETLYER